MFPMYLFDLAKTIHQDRELAARSSSVRRPTVRGRKGQAPSRGRLLVAMGRLVSPHPSATPASTRHAGDVATLGPTPAKRHTAHRAPVALSSGQCSTAGHHAA
jgi:hypothetical protein